MGGVASSEEVLSFWFGTASQLDPPPADRMRLWFRGGPEVDLEIRERFGADLERARKGELDAWANSAHGRLALIIVLDQFSRNAYRGSGEAFVSDALAQKLTLDGLDRGHDQGLAPFEQLFFILPLEHAENLALQDRALSYFEDWAKRVPDALQGMARGALDFARLHRDVIARFGRFPTRNRAVGRTSTPEEEAHVRAAEAAGRPV